MSDRQERFRQLLRRGTRLLKQGQLNQALPLLLRAYEIDGEDPDAALNLSAAYILSGRFKEAIPILETLGEQEPGNVMVWINIGAAYLGNPVLATDGDQQRAIAAFKYALELNPVAPNAAYNLGLIYRDRRELDEAIHWFREALKADPRDEHARNILARLTQTEEE